MAKCINKFALLTVLITAAIPSWGNPPQSKQSKPQNQADTRPARQLPEGGSELPLLSVIGMGILSGGVLSALKTRPARAR
ncbi:MAG: hypothetical protein JWN45_632 [Acidobacteriaceae bacterium]|nr:hypothetical protein [Acidobacteriaceae bacterium]